MKETALHYGYGMMIIALAIGAIHLGTIITNIIDFKLLG